MHFVCELEHVNPILAALPYQSALDHSMHRHRHIGFKYCLGFTFDTTIKNPYQSAAAYSMKFNSIFRTSFELISPLAIITKCLRQCQS